MKVTELGEQFVMTLNWLPDLRIRYERTLNHLFDDLDVRKLFDNDFNVEKQFTGMTNTSETFLTDSSPIHDFKLHSPECVLTGWAALTHKLLVSIVQPLTV